MIKRLLHRLIWQSLPQPWRRTGLFVLTRLLAARPDRAPPQGCRNGPIWVAGFFRSATGLGEGARLSFDSLKAAGLDVRPVDLSAAMMQDTDYTAWAQPSAALDGEDGLLILHVNAPLVPLALLRLGRKGVRGKRIAGVWAWELPDLPADWRWGLDRVHEAWPMSRFVADAIRRKAPHLPVRIVPHPVPPFEGTPAERTPAGGEDGSGGDGGAEDGGEFHVLIMFNMASSFARKNPLAGIEAFTRAFGGDPACRLTVKVSNAAAYPEGLRALRAAARPENIRLIDGLLPRPAVDALVARADVLLSLHRAEGFGLPLAEAMRAGKVVVATDWSGNVDFLDEDNGCPVPCTFVPARDPQKVYDYPDQKWAEPDIGAAASALRRLRAEPELRARLGRQARADAERLFSPRHYATLVADALKDGESPFVQSAAIP